MSVRLDWRGDQVRAAVHDSALAAHDETLDRAVEAARASHPSWRSDTGEAESSITVLQKARREGSRIVGQIGSALSYFIYLEVGSRGHAGDATLRRAGDSEFGKLGDRTRARFGEHR